MKSDLIENRSDVLILYDAKNCNPNGNPLSPNNEPRRDSMTGLAEVTAGRIKRYLRDQMFDDGNDILVQKPGQYENNSEDIYTLDELWEEIVEDLKNEGIEVEDADMDEYFDAVVEKLMDVRFFGSVFAEVDDMTALRGPVQFQIGQSLHRTKPNKETSKITGVVSTGDGSGGSMGTDERLRYALFGVDGAINEQVAKNTNFTKNDAEYLDKLVWRALKTQTHSNSKSGQSPRGYIRVEYSTDNFQIQNLSEYLGLELQVDSDEEIRSVNDYSIDVSNLNEVLSEYEEHIERVRVHTDFATEFTIDSEEVSLIDCLQSDEYTVEEINPYE